MEQIKVLYWSFQSSQTINPTEKQLELFQRKYKSDYQQRTVFEGEELLDKFRLNSWRNAMFSEITSIIIAFEHENTLRVKYISGIEKDLLQNFNNLLRNSFQDYNLVHFDAGIVLPYIGVRLNKNGFITPPHQDLKYHNLRPWGLTGIDLKEYYKGAGDYSYSLEEIGDILGIDTNSIIPYEDEFTYYNSQDFEALKISAIKKVEVISKCYRKLQNQSELETVLIEETVKDVVEEKPKDWLKELYYANQMTSEIAEGLKQQIFSGKKPLKKDLENLFTIIRGVYLRTNFEVKDQDSKKTIELKEQEIKQLLGL